jgi:ADP-ribosylglycohydrolase
MEPKDRFRGCLLGLAIGDAVGTTLEFKPPGTFKHIVDMVGGGPFNLKPGEWTDDTSMALCLAESLIEKQGFDPVDQLERYIRWHHAGYLSNNGRCLDIGNTVRQALVRSEKTRDVQSGSIDPGSAGNGSLMRLAPVPLFFARNPVKAIKMSGESSRTTHGACVDACRYFKGLIVGAVNGASKQELLSDRICPIKGSRNKKPLVPEIDEIAAGSYKEKNPPAIKGTGLCGPVSRSRSLGFPPRQVLQGWILMAVNLGDDADTTGAVLRTARGRLLRRRRDT